MKHEELIGERGGGRKIYTITELNKEVRGVLETRYAGVWVEGEVSNYKRHSSGHIYLTLKDEQSQISAVFFSFHHRGLKFGLEDGLKVLAYGRASVYEARGQYQFYIERVEAKGVGALQLAFQQLKEKLWKEGLFNEERKRPIPKFPKTVGVITSPTGAAIHDILNVIGRRSGGTNVLLCPVKVQGDGAAEEVAGAIRMMNDFGEAEVLIVGRGGGSLEDLWAFNEEPVARAIYGSKIPVISAVGHETDWTIADFVADLRAPTPSAAAELVVANRLDLEERLRDRTERLRWGMRSLAEQHRQKLEYLGSSAAFKQPRYLLEQFAERTDELGRRLQGIFASWLALKRQVFATLTGRMNALNPIGILERGYSVSFAASGAVLKDAARVKTGEEIITRLHKGKLVSRVIKTEKE
ncbi:MAG TPA: exodeoxyribonuclease VII large subunit [Candidatus Omnitrophota bacterium]|jgi:exodeoxyribonuclease VII large subunit|nr:MAG: Exodeoxyribonuclease 7 large subunit [Candidatus Omnitrophica bacterium ADurb.Bin314]HOE68502.1 exodeoxyribonuclease VII large subunit [Candidatus Omnitrophota bacterium]HPW64892.1 exodeoxyribonuclease VII large subunit [Candidatus Omnitrophota bacterium]HQB94149.1 exodeoxyribonuclease VII large subunit [Candidatus Omnitrophota bacterium]